VAETFTTIAADVGDWLGANAARLPTAKAGKVINMVQREFLRSNDVRFGEYNDTFPTVIGQRGYDLPAGFSRPFELYYIDSDGSQRTLNWMPEVDRFLQRYPNPAKTGDPVDFTTWGNQFLLGPTPSSVRTVYRFYYRTLPDLIDGAPNNTNDLVDKAPDLLLWGALAFATTYLFEDSRSGVYQANFDRVKAEVLFEHARAKSSAGVLQSSEP
jgi:hypothetical protein